MKKLMKTKILDYVESKGKSGVSYTDIIKFIIKQKFNREYDYKTDRGYYSGPLSSCNIISDWYPNVEIGYLRKSSIKEPRYLMKEVNKFNKSRWFVVSPK